MQYKAQNLYNALAIFVLGTGLFVLQQSYIPKVADWQDGIKQEFGKAFVQTVGDQPLFTEFGFVFDSVNDFYNQAADAAIALIASPQSDQDIAFVFGSVYNTFAQALMPKLPVALNIPLEKFMTEEPLYNIIPDIGMKNNQEVAGTSFTDPVNANNSWVTIEDNSTGQLYCLAIYNGEVNKYLGVCKSDYH